MRILDRYIGTQVLTTAFFAISVLSLVLVMGNIFKQLLDLLVNHDVPLESILTFIAYIIPFSLTFTIPWGFLTAVLLVFGRLSAENELIALRSNGVSVPRVCAPIFCLALVCVGICLWINLDVAPRAQSQMKAALYDIATHNPIAMFGSDQIIDQFPGRLIYVEKKNGTQLDDILMFNLDTRGEPTEVVHAQKGELQTDLAQNEILLKLNNARYEQRDATRPGDLRRIREGITANKIPVPISLQELEDKNKKRVGPSQMTLTELIKDNNDPVQATARKTEVNKRFSFSLASFAFCLIAVPLAITAHRKETSVGFLFSLLVAFVYFFLIILVDTVHNSPKMHPEVLIWMPNVIFISLGAYLFARMSRR